MVYKAIFLDVDGVLLDSEKVFNACWREAAKEEGYMMSFEQALELRSLDSSLAKQLFKKWYGDEDVYHAVRKRRRQIMAEYSKTVSIERKPKVMDFIHSLEDSKIEVMIVTSSPVSRISEYLWAAGIDVKLFDDIITTEAVARGKPFPDVYLFACESKGLSPNECIAVEDSPNGLRSAHSAGCFTIFVPDLSPYSEDLFGCVDFVADDLMDIVGCIR